MEGHLVASSAQSNVQILHRPHLPCDSISPDLTFDLDYTPAENIKSQIEDPGGSAKRSPDAMLKVCQPWQRLSAASFQLSTI